MGRVMWWMAVAVLPPLFSIGCHLPKSHLSHDEMMNYTKRVSGLLVFLESMQT